MMSAGPLPSSVMALPPTDANQDRHLFVIDTLFQAAQKAGLLTVLIGPVRRRASHQGVFDEAGAQYRS